jgi:hypothetical protein
LANHTAPEIGRQKRTELAAQWIWRDHQAMPLADELRQTLAAAVDRIIPEDDFPGAWAAGVGEYIARLLAGDFRDRAGEFERGLVELDGEAVKHFGKGFAALTSEEQDQILAGAEKSQPQFFDLLVTLSSPGEWLDMIQRLRAFPVL